MNAAMRLQGQSRCSASSQSMAEERVVSAESVCRVFEHVFAAEFATQLRGGAQEPIYTPRTLADVALIQFRHDYVSSALHEVAHWCIAGPERRCLEDYGYWYAPDGRSETQQLRFVAAEARPQALEWFFSMACVVPFRISIDNLDAPENPELASALANAVSAQAQQLRVEGLPPRAARFFEALSREFNPGLCAQDLDFTVDQLQ